MLRCRLGFFLLVIAACGCAAPGLEPPDLKPGFRHDEHEHAYDVRRFAER